jgi:Flp pilus assembly protein CpaB
MYNDTHRPQAMLVLLIALGCGLAASFFVARMVQQPADVLNQQVFTPGESDLAVKTSPDDLVAGLLRPGQYVDILVSEDPRPDGKKMYRLLLEQIQVVAVASNADAASAPSAPVSSQVTLKLNKQQADELRPFQDKGVLRFIARQPAVTKN